MLLMLGGEDQRFVDGYTHNDTSQCLTNKATRKQSNVKGQKIQQQSTYNKTSMPLKRIFGKFNRTKTGLKVEIIILVIRIILQLL